MTIKYLPTAEKQLAKLDRPVQVAIKKYMDEVAELKDPRSRGKSLVGNRRGFWRYRVANYRVICQIRDEQLIITIVEIGHRKNIYD